MNIRILSIGKLKEKYWRDAVSEYAKRLSSYCTLNFEEVRESPTDNVDEEGDALLKRIKKDDYLITLDVRGKAMSSPQLAQTIEELAISGRSRVVFVIGGSCGLGAQVSERADLKLSFSAMTFPHQMIRVILMEQIYRSFKIIRGEAYHK